ncbi:MAG: STAS domain-containing protein [Sphingomonas sp.]|jgi:anti-anti-sigma regulatory factor
MKTIPLPAHCDRAAAAALVDDLNAAIDGGPVTIDGGAVTRIGQSMMQLIISAQKTAQARGHVLEVMPSDAMRETCGMVGLGDTICSEARS